MLAAPCIKVVSGNLIQFSNFFFNLAGLTAHVRIMKPAQKHKTIQIHREGKYSTDRTETVWQQKENKNRNEIL
jgi:hypothetical protein